jgi:hypothetical protein
MNNAYIELANALSEMLDKIDLVIKSDGYTGDPISMYLAGGMAINYYCGLRYTEDVDASFSRRLLLPYEELTVNYTMPGGKPSFIYFDQNYNTSFALMHEAFENDSVKWDGIGNESRKVELRVLSPLDLAVSKIARYSDQDQDDIAALAARGFFTSADLRARANEALLYYVGNTASVRTGINLICDRIDRENPHQIKPERGG